MRAVCVCAQVAHPNLFSFLGHLQRATTDYMTDKERLDNGLPIRRPRKKAAIKNETRLQTCAAKYDRGEYTRMQFLRAVSHFVAHNDALQVSCSDTEDENDNTASASSTAGGTDDMCVVCLLVPRAGVALVPCGHRRFCASCAHTVAAMDSVCPLCRTPIQMVLRLF